jgi:hypothetical protein
VILSIFRLSSSELLLYLSKPVLRKPETSALSTELRELHRECYHRFVLLEKQPYEKL